MPTKSKAAIAAIKAEAANTIAVEKPILTKAGAAKIAAVGCTHHLRAFLLLHTAGLYAAGGLLTGLATYHLANKFLFSKKDKAE